MKKEKITKKHLKEWIQTSNFFSVMEQLKERGYRQLNNYPILEFDITKRVFHRKKVFYEDMRISSLYTAERCQVKGYRGITFVQFTFFRVHRDLGDLPVPYNAFLFTDAPEAE